MVYKEPIWKMSESDFHRKTRIRVIKPEGGERLPCAVALMGDGSLRITGPLCNSSGEPGKQDAVTHAHLNEDDLLRLRNAINALIKPNNGQLPAQPIINAIIK